LAICGRHHCLFGKSETLKLKPVVAIAIAIVVVVVVMIQVVHYSGVTGDAFKLTTSTNCTGLKF